MKKHSLLSIILVFAISVSNGQNAFDKRSVKKSGLAPEFVKQIPLQTGADRSSGNAAKFNLNPRKEINIRRVENKRRAIVNNNQAIEQAYLFLNQEGPAAGLRFDLKNYKAFESIYDEQGIYHVKLQQVFNGLEVYGSEIYVHLMPSETYSHGSWYEIPSNLSVSADISQKAAVGIAMTAIKPEMGLKTLSPLEKSILKYNEPELSLMVVIVERSPVLCYDLTIRPNFLERWKVRINAKTGEVIESYDYTCHVDGPRVGSGTDLNNVTRTVNSYQLGSSFYLIDGSRSMFSLSASVLPDDPTGAVWTIDAGNTPASSFNQLTSGTQDFNNPKAVSAHYNAGVAFEYYKNTFNRNSINGSGGTIISVINISSENGTALDNAYWNGTFMAYGNGKTTFKPLAGSLDVAGHELTHGVVENSANLEYKKQSGAINESMADIFGCMIDRDDWRLGEDIMKPGVSQTGALRDMQDPHNGGSSLSDNFYQPKHMTEYYNGTQDNGGVHINSGIPNHAFYLFATAVGKQKAEQVYYKALTVYLTKTSEFKDLRLAVIQASLDIYGATEASQAAVAFDAVGIYGPPVGGNIGNNVADLGVNPGQDFMLFYDLDQSVSFTLSKATLSTLSTQGQITRDIKRKASVVDNGAYCVYVGTDGRIYSLLLDGSKSESVMSNQTIWENVAISKDGKRIAAVTTTIDTSIYVYDFTKAEWRQFKLYNPTYSGVNSGGVLFADALEWDHTGTRIMYDAKNLINNNSGTDYTYWDVGIMQVWDLETNAWSGGKIEKIFSSLPDDVSIGNAVFSQRSPYIVAFDYINGATGEYLVVGHNLNTSESGTIFSGKDLGFPCYSKNDDVLIFNAFNTFNDEVIARIDLASDKINKNGSATVLITEAKWGVWYANGTRPLLFSNKDITSFAFQGLNPAVNCTISGTNITCTVPSNTNLTELVASFIHSAYSQVKIGAIVQTSGVNKNDFSTTRTYTVIAQDGTTKNYNVTVTKSSVLIDDIAASSLRVYPNPVISSLTFEHQVDIQSVSIFSTSGQLLQEYEPMDKVFAADMQFLKPGLYFAIINTLYGSQVYWFTRQD
jgi:bacillolysin